MILLAEYLGGEYGKPLKSLTDWKKHVEMQANVSSIPSLSQVWTGLTDSLNILEDDSSINHGQLLGTSRILDVSPLKQESHLPSDGDITDYERLCLVLWELEMYVLKLTKDRC